MCNIQNITSDSIELRDQIFVKGYGFLSFAKTMGKNLSGKYSQKLLNHAKQSTTDALKALSKRAVQKTAEGTGDLIGNKIADKITKVLRTSSQNTSERVPSETEDIKFDAKIPKERYILSEKRLKIFDKLRSIQI